MMVRFFKMTFPKAVCVLFQALTALIVIKFFPHKIVQNEGLESGSHI